MKRLLPLLAALALLSSLGRFDLVGAAAATPPLPKGVLFLGDSITYSGQYVEFFEAVIRCRFSQWDGEILNLGLPSETVSGLSEVGHAGGAFLRPDLHERLGRVLAAIKPDLVIACYGMNDGIYLPLSPDRFQAFQQGITRLRAAVLTQGASLILLTPPSFDPAPKATGFNYNEVLDHFSDWLLAQREHGWTVLDIHGPMNRRLAEHRLSNPGYRLADDGVHPDETGHWLMALPLLLYFGAPPGVTTAGSARQFLASRPNGLQILTCVQQRQRILKDAWLTQTGHKRPGMNKGLPMPEAKERAAKLDAQLRTLLAGQEPTRR